MMLWIKLASAGLGPLIWHWGIGVGVIILILAVEYFLGYLPFVERFRKDLLWVAVGIALVLVGEYIAARDMAARCQAKAAVIESTVGNAVDSATKAPGLDRWDTDK